MARDFDFYIVPTPIGNISDITFRSIEVLKKVDLIACEDCRTSSNLLSFYGITTKLVSYHKFNEKQRTQEFLNLINDGKRIALISDAGTPCISDPGRVLVKELFEKNVKVTTVPGCNAVASLLSIVPRESEEFAFVGFLPKTNIQQSKIFEKYTQTDMVFYDSPNRLLETLSNIANSRGENSKVAIGRELTKKFEEVKVGTVSEITDYFNTNVLKGEIVGMLYAENSLDALDSEILEKIKKLKEQNFSDKDISKILSVLFGYNKNKVYKLAVSIG